MTCWRRRLLSVSSVRKELWIENCTSPSSKRYICTPNVVDTGYQTLKSPSIVSLDSTDVWDSGRIYSGLSFVQASYDDSIANKIDGHLIAEEIRRGIASEISRMKASIGEVPGLAVVLVGQRRDSQTYVRNKILACEEVGINFELTEFPENCTEDDICHALMRFNNDTSIHGILVQLPLPQHLNTGRILDVIRLRKDVDGVHPLNIGHLALQGREPLFIPCTPKGCIELLLRSNVEIEGKHAVVIGRSNIVGLPMSLLLQRYHATVSIVHAFTKNPEEITRKADILVAGAGVPNLVRGSWIKPGAFVIDVGTNAIEDPDSENGYRLIGDVCYEEAVKVASAVTPVPGGVGPMTVAMLLYNTLESAKRIFKF
ncbi:OLC1v1011581C1 [Oldenlandia corymbosa var. corymbosa]|uniref:OLC1v1011581C1 n=1 Tax=Oldenlandia corymbosa var. corymbosa TaxID=529605 RepID=A0AAV1DTW7_OLDCO|nr:OLC1v1011581C1 [Oldenlandia corymbosa var. corymbosa]